MFPAEQKKAYLLGAEDTRWSFSIRLVAPHGQDHLGGLLAIGDVGFNNLDLQPRSLI